jgi:hypothetical protein
VARGLPSSPYPTTKHAIKHPKDHDEEMGKRLAGAVKKGHLAFLLDNIPNGMEFGSATPDSFVTVEADATRLLGTNDVDARLMRTVLMVCGNGISPKGDTVRRVLPMWFEIPPGVEPSEDGFEGLEVCEWARRNRTQLFVAAITIVSAYILDGRPDMMLPHWGSFEAWDLIRGALVWAGHPPSPPSPAGP